MAHIVEQQRAMARAILLAAERGLKAIPLQVRQRIYTFAFSTRATPDADSILEEATETLQIHVHVRQGYPGDAPWSGLGPADWVLNMPSEAAINDVKRCIHRRLCEINRTFPSEDRMCDYEMSNLRI